MEKDRAFAAGTGFCDSFFEWRLLEGMGLDLLIALIIATYLRRTIHVYLGTNLN